MLSTFEANEYLIFFNYYIWSRESEPNSSPELTNRYY